MNILPRPFAALLALLCLSLAGALPCAEAQAITPASAPAITVQAYSGEQEPSGPEGSDFLHFFTPEVGFFLSVVSPPHPGATGSNVLDVGGLYGEFPNAILTGLTPPTGDGLLATFKPGVGGVTAGNNVAMLYGELDTPSNISTIAETGATEGDLPEGVTIKKFLTMDGEGVPFFLAILQGTGVTAANSLALCTFNYSYNQENVRRLDVPAPDSLSYYDSPLIILARTGDSVMTSGSSRKTIKTITTLVGSKGTLADGRWRLLYDGESEFAEIGVLIQFTDGSEQIYTIPTYAEEDPTEWTPLQPSGFVSYFEGLNGYTITSFGLPAFDNVAFAALANLQHGGITLSIKPKIHAALRAVKGSATSDAEAGVNSSNDVALIYGSVTGNTNVVLARKGDPVTEDSDGNPLTGVTISGLSDPVVGNQGGAAFMITMSGTHAPAAGIEYTADGYEATPSLLANVGASAPDVTGTGTVGHWAGFISLVLPSFVDFYNYGDLQTEGYAGPIFLGTLKISATDGVTAGNNLGLWALNGDSTLQLLFRSGQTVNVNGLTKTVRTFTALTSASGSVGAVHGYDDYGNVSVIATFTDGTTALLILSTASSST